MSVYTHVCTHAYLYTRTSVHACPFTTMSVHACLHMLSEHVCLYTHMSLRAFLYTHVYTHMCVYMHMSVHAHFCTHAFLYMRMSVRARVCGRACLYTRGWIESSKLLARIDSPKSKRASACSSIAMTEHPSDAAGKLKYPRCAPPSRNAQRLSSRFPIPLWLGHLHNTL